MYLSMEGKIALKCWQEIPAHHANTQLDEFVVMPNHVHGIVVIEKYLVGEGTVPVVETLRATSLQKDEKFSKLSPSVGSLSTIIRSYKSAVTRLARLTGFSDFAWQSRFYDHIIRDDRTLTNIQRYIVENPIKWELDKDNPSNLKM